jgi:hypothetical protein
MERVRRNYGINNQNCVNPFLHVPFIFVLVFPIGYLDLKRGPDFYSALFY